MKICVFPILAGKMAEKGISRSALSCEVGVSKDTVTNWMCGKSKPNIDMAFAIQSAVSPETPLDRLFASSKQKKEKENDRENL